MVQDVATGVVTAFRRHTGNSLGLNDVTKRCDYSLFATASINQFMARQAMQVSINGAKCSPNFSAPIKNKSAVNNNFPNSARLERTEYFSSLRSAPTQIYARGEIRCRHNRPTTTTGAARRWPPRCPDYPCDDHALAQLLLPGRHTKPKPAMRRVNPPASPSSTLRAKRQGRKQLAQGDSDSSYLQGMQVRSGSTLVGVQSGAGQSA